MNNIHPKAYFILVQLLDKDVLRFEISVNDFLGMEKPNSLLCITYIVDDDVCTR